MPFFVVDKNTYKIFIYYKDIIIYIYIFVYVNSIYINEDNMDKTEILLAIENAGTTPNANQYLDIAKKLQRSKLKYDKDIALALIKKYPHYLTGGLPDEMKQDEDLRFEAFKADPSLFPYAPERIRSDMNMLQFVLDITNDTQHLNMIKGVSPSLYNDPDFWLTLLEKDTMDNLFFLNDSFISHMPSFMKKDFDLMFKMYKKIREKNPEQYGKRPWYWFFKDVPSDIQYELVKIDQQEKKGQEHKKNFLRIKIGTVTITIVSKIERDDIDTLLNLKKSLFKTIIKINNSIIPDFNKVLEDTIFAGTHNDIHEVLRSNIHINPTALGEYFEHTKEVAIYFTKKYSFLSVPTLIHEFAHKYCFALNMEKRGLLEELWEKAFSGKFCVLAPKPKIGDSLANIASSYLSPKGLEWTQDYERLSLEKLFKEEGIDVKEGLLRQKHILEGYKLVNISRAGYTYLNPEEEEKLVFSGETITKMIKCPSEYPIQAIEVNDPHAFDEWLAEMITLITLNKVKPAQKRLVSEFIAILKGLRKLY